VEIKENMLSVFFLQLKVLNG